MYPFNMYNIQKNQNPKTHAPQKGKEKKNVNSTFSGRFWP